MSRFAFCSALVLALMAASHGYPVTVENCGVSNSYASAPTRVITMNQAATEFMLALGLEGSMVGTAYLDDAIWPKYAAAYGNIPVLSAFYPNETHIMAQSPDFIVGSFNSAFRAHYYVGDTMRGIFSTQTVGPCTGPGSDWGESWTTCRPQLHNRGVGTYLFEESCEDTSLRPTMITEDTVYEEMRDLASVFGVDATPVINEMKQDFNEAASLVSAGMTGAPLRAVWLDCVGVCCNVPEGQEQEVYVGGGTGVPNVLMQEAGLSNAFATRSGTWVCVKVSDIVASKPDIIVVVDATWDSAIGKIEYLYNDAEFCQLEVLRAARFVSIPFSATYLSPRNGPAALDLAVAALHVRTGSHPTTQKSGVSSFSPYFLQSLTSGMRCPLNMTYVVYDDATDSPKTSKTTTTTHGDQVSEVELTCGEIKKAYKEGNCCGNPNVKFKMKNEDRRLLTSTAIEEEALLALIESALKEASGSAEANKLAKNIAGLLPEWR